MFSHMAHDVLQELNGLHVGCILHSFLNLYWLSVVLRNRVGPFQHADIKYVSLLLVMSNYWHKDSHCQLATRFQVTPFTLTLCLVNCKIAGLEGIRRLKKYCNKPTKLYSHTCCENKQNFIVMVYFSNCILWGWVIFLTGSKTNHFVHYLAVVINYECTLKDLRSHNPNGLLVCDILLLDIRILKECANSNDPLPKRFGWNSRVWRYSSFIFYL
jgi:hypothetical protein